MYKTVPLNVSIFPWITNCLAPGVLSGRGKQRSCWSASEQSRVKLCGESQKSATHSHWSTGELPGICTLVIYILFQTVHILKRKRKLKARFSKEHRQFVCSLWLHVSSREEKATIFFLAFWWISQQNISKGMWHVTEQQMDLCRVQWCENASPNQIGWPVWILALLFLKLYT